MLDVLTLFLVAWIGFSAPAQAVPPPAVQTGGPRRGVLDKEEIRQVIRSHIAEVKDCYELQLVSNPELQGRMLVRFTISASGAVSAANVQSSTFNDPIVEQCILESVRTWIFPRPQGGIVIVTYPFVLKALDPDQSAATAQPPHAPNFRRE